MEGDGMMAVVHSLPDAGLAVTLLSGRRQYNTTQNEQRKLQSGGTTKKSEDNQGRDNYARTNHDRGNQRREFQDSRDNRKSHCHSGVQVTDGRYTSTYKVMHCHVSPTSPAVEVSEFPPQRELLTPGDGNFKIAGTGSRESNVHLGRSNHLRSDTFWIDKARLLRSDAEFASTLRKYPNLTPDRSSEMVEKIITYSQAKYQDATTGEKRNKSSSSHHVTQVESQMLNKRRPQNGSYERSVPRISRHLKNFQNRYDESPTRERLKKHPQDGVESWRRSTFASTSDMRYLQDVTRRVKEGIRSMTSPNSDNSVNMKIQAAVQMISKETDTVSLPIEIQKSIGVRLSPSPSILDYRIQTNVLHKPQTKEREVSRGTQCIQTVDVEIQAEIQTNKNASENENFKRLLEDLKLPVFYGANNLRRESVRRSYSDFQVSSTNLIERTHGTAVTIFDMYKNNTMSHKNWFFEYNQTENISNANDKSLKDAIVRWLNIILIKTGRCVDPFEIDFIFQYLYKRLKQLKENNNLSENNIQYKVKYNKSELLNKTDLTKENMTMIIDKLTDLLVEKVRTIYKKKRRNYIEISQRSDKNKELTPLDDEQDTVRELRRVITSNMHSLLLKHDVLLPTQDKIFDIVNELLDVFHTFKYTKDCQFLRSIIIHTLKVNGIREKEVINISEHLFNIFITEINKTDKIIPRLSKSLMVFPAKQLQSALSQEIVSQNNNLKFNGIVNYSNNKSPLINNRNLTNLSFDDIQHEVGTWLQLLNLEKHLKVPKETAIDSLASEINNRQKYLYWNSTCKTSSKIELDYLKYQIFKWSDKYFPEHSFVPLENADKLFNRIKRQDILKNKQSVFEKTPNANSINNYNFSQVFYNSNQNSAVRQVSINQNKTAPLLINCETMSRRQVGCCQSSLEDNRTEQQIYENFIQFINEWIQDIPIDVSTSEEEKIAEKARLGLHNGIWKAITMLNSNPSIYSDQLLYEDLLGNEIDDLLDCLPQTHQLQAKRYCLKVRLISKTIETIKGIYKSREQSLKNILIQKIHDHLRSRKLGDTTDLSIKSCISSLAGNFIVLNKYSKENPVRANIYSNKLAKDIEKLYKSLMNKHRNLLNTYTIDLFQNELIKELQDMSMPNEVLLKEADKILLGFEIDQWLLDLPLTSKSIFKNENERRILRDKLTSRIIEIDSNVGVNNNDKLIALKTEILKFLEQLLSQKEKAMNVNFLADELINRINNMIQSNQLYANNNNNQTLSAKLIKTLDKNKLHLKENEILESHNFHENKPTDQSIPGLPNSQSDIPLCCSTFKETQNKQWYTLREDNSKTLRNDVEHNLEDDDVIFGSNVDYYKMKNNMHLKENEILESHNFHENKPTDQSIPGLPNSQSDIPLCCSTFKETQNKQWYTLREDNSKTLRNDVEHNLEDDNVISGSNVDYYKMGNGSLLKNNMSPKNEINLMNKCEFNSDVLNDNVQDSPLTSIHCPQMSSQTKSDNCIKRKDYGTLKGNTCKCQNGKKMDVRCDFSQSNALVNATNELSMVEEEKISHNYELDSGVNHEAQVNSQSKSDPYDVTMKYYESLEANQNFSIKEGLEGTCYCFQDRVVPDVTHKLDNVTVEKRRFSDSKINSDDLFDSQLTCHIKSDYSKMIIDFETLVAGKNLSNIKSHLENGVCCPRDEITPHVTNKHNNNKDKKSYNDSQILHNVQDQVLKSQLTSDYSNMIKDYEALVTNNYNSGNKTNLEIILNCPNDININNSGHNMSKLRGQTEFSSNIQGYCNTRKSSNEGMYMDKLINADEAKCQTYTTEVNGSKRIPSICRHNNSKDIGINVSMNNRSTCECLAANLDKECFTSTPEFNDGYCQCFRRFRNYRNKCPPFSESQHCYPFVPMFTYPYFL